MYMAIMMLLKDGYDILFVKSNSECSLYFHCNYYLASLLSSTTNNTQY